VFTSITVENTPPKSIASDLVDAAADVMFVSRCMDLESMIGSDPRLDCFQALYYGY
jgi:hypothetical protein